MSETAFAFLSERPLFESLPEAEVRRIAGLVTVKRYPRGKTLFTQKRSRVDAVHIIREGALEIYYDTGEGEKILTNVLNRGEIFGGISILMNEGNAIRTVKAKADTECYRIPKDVFMDLCRRYNTLYEHFADLFSRRMMDVSYAAVVAANQIFAFLSGLAPFSFLPEEELERVSKQISIVRYPPEERVFIQGIYRVEQLHIIQKGAAERYYEQNQQKILRGVLGEGAIFGGISILINDGIAVRSLKTLEETFFYTLPKAEFIDLCRRFPSFSEYFTDVFGKRMLDQSYAAVIKKSFRPRDEAQFFDQPISLHLTKDLVICGEDVSIQEAAAVMSREKCSSIFVKNPDGDLIGLVTDNDFRRKVIAAGMDVHAPVSRIMSTPLVSIPAQALVFEALMTMMQQNVKHLAATDEGGKVVGVVTNGDLLAAQGHSPLLMIREISTAGDLESITEAHKRLPWVIQSLINSGAKSKIINRLVTTISDAILQKLIRFTLDAMGEPPCPFVFMIMGSEGRKEQTLKTDQDNAIVYTDVSSDSRKTVQTYFEAFGEKVCTWLDQAGYAFCEGGVMAMNPKWCQPLSVWKQYFSHWIHTAEAEDLLQSSIFFDFRGAFGEMALVEDLQKHLFDSLSGWVGFFRHLTQNALHFKPPLGFFRNFVVESKGEHRDAFNIKDAMMPIVDFARIYALNHRIEETNTQERLHRLFLKGVLSREEYHELEQAYSFLMQLRFVRQITAIIEENEKPDNYVVPKKLSRIEQTMLKEIFKRTEKFQSKLDFDFTGLT